MVPRSKSPTDFCVEADAGCREKVTTFYGPNINADLFAVNQ